MNLNCEPPKVGLFIKQIFFR